MQTFWQGPGKEFRSARAYRMRRAGIVKNVSLSRKNGDAGGSIDSAGVEDARGYGLISRSHQGKAVRPRMGTCIRRSEFVGLGKHGG